MAAATTTLERVPDSVWPIILHQRPGQNLANREDFYEFCRDNEPWRIERGASGALEVAMPAGWETGNRNQELSGQLWLWARQEGAGRAADSSAGFELPGGAMRSPDASWVRKTRLESLTATDRQRFLPLAPDFVAELRSESDRLAPLQEKMQEYLDAGVSLALLLDPTTRRVTVYRPNQEPIFLDNPTTVDCSPELPGFILNVKAIFDAGEQ